MAKNIILYNSGKFLRVLQQANLVDEQKVYIHHVVLGDGKRMFQNNSGRTFFQSRTLKNFPAELF